MSERMSAGDAAALLAGGKRRHKYNAKATVIDGQRFDSRAEARRYIDLRNLQRGGRISGLTRQPKYPIKVRPGEPVKIRSKGFPNGRATTYVADFRYYDHDRQRVVVEDVKGQDTPLSRLKRALVEAYYGITVEVIR